jgi:hypothetical protein
MSYTTWLQSLQSKWLQGQQSQVYFGALGGTLDDQNSLLKQAVKCRFPTVAPSDALAAIGDERQLDRGPAETDPGYALRTRAAWNQWPFAGTWPGLLTALHYAGFSGGVIVQQNGLYYTYSATPNYNDLTQNLVIANLDTLVQDLPPFNANPLNNAQTIPAGTPWWLFDGDTGFCSRFAILFPGPLSSLFRTTGRATFTGVEDGSLAHPWPTITWNNVFPDTTYIIQVSAPVVTDGSGPVICGIDNTTKTTAGVTITASDSFTGYVDVLAWQSGANPFADLHPPDLARLQSVIHKWRPARATCMGVFVLVQGEYWGWPVGTWGDSGNWGPGTVVVFQGA